ncbi:MAG: hypothetical protein GY786_21300, partial [Proteobacteria bacterium]|nr:hypothetical protein [Pseudomonadota bacterium]
TGKSVLIKSLYLILGNKCPKDLIRPEADYITVEATFSIEDNPDVQKLLDQMEIGNDNSLVLRRKIYRSGKNSVFINDYTSNNATLSKLGVYLIDLHGQHSQQRLLQSSTHMDYLDQFATNSDLVKEFAATYGDLLIKIAKLDKLEKDCNTRENKIDFLQFQLVEIKNADLSINEEKDLLDEFKLLSYGEQMIGSLTPVSLWNSEENSPIKIIDDSLYAIQEAVKIDPNLQKVADELQEGRIILEEAAADISRYLEKLELDPGRLDEVNQRLSELDKIKRKYGDTIERVLLHQVELQEELVELEQLETNLDSLRGEIRSLTEVLEKKSLEISEKRKLKKDSFQQSILKNMEELGLEKSQFLIDISPLLSKDSKLAFGNRGADRVEFLISTNPGQPPKPLAKIASGGELS